MKLCFPVEQYEGADSTVYGHFGSASCFVMVDTDTGKATRLDNGDADHAHGKCSPVKALGGEAIDVVIVGGIGGGALGKLTSSGISVYKADKGTVSHNLSLYNDGKLNRFNPALVCGGHSHKGGCAHH